MSRDLPIPHSVQKFLRFPREQIDYLGRLFDSVNSCSTWELDPKAKDIRIFRYYNRKRKGYNSCYVGNDCSSDGIEEFDIPLASPGVSGLITKEKNTLDILNSSKLNSSRSEKTNMNSDSDDNVASLESEESDKSRKGTPVKVEIQEESYNLSDSRRSSIEQISRDGSSEKDFQSAEINQIAKDDNDVMTDSSSSHDSVHHKKIEPTKSTIISNSDSSDSNSNSHSKDEKSMPPSPQVVEYKSENTEALSPIDVAPAIKKKSKTPEENKNVIKSILKKPHQVSDSECEEPQRDSRKSFLCSTMIETENRVFSEPNSLNVSLITPKQKRTMKDFLISSPKPDQKNTVYYEDINEDIEIFVMQCPENVDVLNFVGKKIILDGEANIDLNNSNFDLHSEKDSTNLNIALPTKNGFKLGVFKSSGSVLITENFEVPTVGEFEVNDFEPIPLPDGLKNSFDTSKFLNNSILENLIVSPKKKKKKHKHEERTVDQQSVQHFEEFNGRHDEITEETAEILEASTGNKKKNKKIKHEIKIEVHENDEMGKWASAEIPETFQPKNNKKKKRKQDATTHETAVSASAVMLKHNSDETMSWIPDEVSEITMHKKKKKKRKNEIEYGITVETQENDEVVDVANKSALRLKHESDELIDEMPLTIKKKKNKNRDETETKIYQAGMDFPITKRKKHRDEFKQENDEILNWVPTEVSEIAVPKKKKKKKIKNESDPDTAFSIQETNKIQLTENSEFEIKLENNTDEASGTGSLKKKKKKRKKEVDKDFKELSTECEPGIFEETVKTKKNNFLDPSLPFLSSFREIQSSDENFEHVKKHKKRKREKDDSLIEEPAKKKKKFPTEEASLFSQCVEPVKTKKKKRKKDKC